MSEEVTQEKQYLLMVDDIGVALLTRLVPGLKFVEVRGLTLKDNPEVQALVNPIPQVNPLEQACTEEVVS